MKVRRAQTIRGLPSQVTVVRDGNFIFTDEVLLTHALRTHPPRPLPALLMQGERDLEFRDPADVVERGAQRVFDTLQTVVERVRMYA